MNAFSNTTRVGSHSVKWDARKEIFGTEDVLPMWIADMDFKAAEVINHAIRERAEHGFYGYTLDKSQQKHVINWVKMRHNFKIKSDEIIFSPGVIPSLNSAINTFTAAGDKILIQTPVYTPFFNLIKDNKRQVVENELILNNDRYEIDFKVLEEQLKQGVKAFILCSPHNPVGRVWTKDELKRIATLCLENDVLIFSDEIHADLTYTGYKHIPLASLSEEISQQTITFMSPTKTFNLAGLQVSYIIAQNKEAKSQLDQTLNRQGLNMINTFGVVGIEAAYTKGEAWLDDLLIQLEKHRDYVKTRLEKETELLKVIHAEGTYLLWIDCSLLGLTPDELNDFFIREAKVGLNRGISYGEAGKDFMRINIACPPELLTEGIDRIIHAVNKKRSL